MILQKILVLMLTLGYIHAKSTYCIQVTTLNSFNEKNINTKVSKILNNYNSARVDKRGNYLILRVGEYNKYSQTLNDLSSIKQIYSDAYVRKCDYIESKTLYPKRKKTYLHRTIKSKNIDLNKPAQYSDSLWNECQKCFAPMNINYKKENIEDVEVIEVYPDNYKLNTYPKIKVQANTPRN